jgi:multimeric flavodoxin WrbA
MAEPILTKEGQEALDIALSIRPAIVREERKQKYMRILSLLMDKQGCKEAGRELVIEVFSIVEPKWFQRSFLSSEDPAAQQKYYLKYTDPEVYFASPIPVKRWQHPSPGKPAKRSEDMKVLAFCASPRKGGNTDVLIDEAIRGAEDVGAKAEKIMLQKMKIGYCIGCRKCKEEGFERWCSLKDDMDEIYPKIVDSDAIIIGFPNYTGRECAQLATFFDRWDCFARFKYVDWLKSGRRGMVIGTWGVTDADVYDELMENMMLLLYMHKIEPVEAISAGGFEGILHGFDDRNKAMVLRAPEALDKAYQAGKSLVMGEG